MTTTWTCPKCTYHHEAKQRHFLTCAICAAPRPTPTASPAKKRQVTLLDHFVTPGGYPLQPRTHRHHGKRSRSLNSINSGNNSDANTTTTADRARHAITTTSLLDVLKPCRASSLAPQARYRDHPKEAWREVPNDMDIAQLCPMTVVRDVLPEKVAAALLKQLETEAATWNRGKWIVNGKQHAIPRTTATYNLVQEASVGIRSREGREVPEEEEEKEKRSTTYILDKNPSIRHRDSKVVPLEEDYDEEYLDQNREISPALQQVAECISKLVQQRCPHESDWQPTFAFCNRYADGQDCVGWHADHLTPLGPRPIIVGLSLGACRRFELRQMAGNKTTDTLTTTTTTTRRRRHVSVPLPHNSVCIMWNDAQESWQHCVPRCKEALVRHPSVGAVRISVTFRKQRQVPELGHCQCGRPVGLKAKDGRYYLFCRPYGKGKKVTCGLWKPCVWAEQEANRLLELERQAALGAEIMKSSTH